ncbi:hypothetical protein ONZ51_g9243 [Trametes cubensis]|uniref:Uncharacterized protein n=1 Tax=Trametes cubensis TaxID=1111947 RepID=A0AAD7TLQ6_9APHY|nr:hypothetical protein ONZ51_g9243 [Trametes cubensis]
MDTVDIPFDSIWCPVCSRQIVPKRIHLPIPPPSSPAPPSVPAAREHSLPSLAFIHSSHLSSSQSPKLLSSPMHTTALLVARLAQFAQGLLASSTVQVV